MTTKTFWVLFCALIALLAASADAASIEQVEPSAVQPLFRYQGCVIAYERDLLDFDEDKETGERYYVITRILYNCPFDRDTTFDFKPSDGIKRTTIVSKAVRANFTIPLFARLTEENFGWNFTPAHVGVVPGSVSNPSLLTSGGNAASTGSDTTASFTPTASSLLVVAWSTRRNTSPPTTHTFSNTHAGSGAWSDIQNTGGGVRLHSHAIAQMGASPGSGTITNTYDGANTPVRRSWIVAEITGHNTTTPQSENNVGGATSGTSLTINLGGIAAGNLAIGTLLLQGNTAVTQGTNETELAEADSTGTSNIRTQMEYGTDTAVDWSWTTSDHNRGVAVEYAAAAAPPAEAGQIIIID